MPNTPNSSSSFIPKQGPVRKPRQTATRQIQILSVVSYVSIVATVIASGGVYFYQKYTEKQLETEVQNFKSATSVFNTEDMDRVRAFNTRLNQARERLDNSVSISSVFTALEDATLRSVTIESLTLERNKDASLELEAAINTDTFDSALFQRGVLERSYIAETVEVEDLLLGQVLDEEENRTGELSLSLATKITIPVKSVINRKGETSVVPQNVVPAPVPVATSSEPTEEEVLEAEEGNATDL